MNAWHWWQEALANPRDIGQAHLPVSVDSPEQGFYRTRFKGKPWEPVAIWKEDGQWIALRNGRPVSNPLELWNWCCRHPISAEAYETALAGEGWTDDDPTVAAMLGDNIRDTSELDSLKDQIESAKQGAEAYADIASDEQAAKAQSLRARMNELAGKADKQRETLKKPHLEAGKAIDAEWMPLVKEAKGVADQIRRYIETFETAKLMQRRLEERQRAEAEREVGPDVAPPPPLPPETMVKGNYGRGASVKSKLVVTGISDIGKLLNWYAGDTRLHAFLLELAQKDTSQGLATVPGVTVEERAALS